MDLTVSSYRIQQPSFKGLVRQSFTDALLDGATSELNKVRKFANENVTEIGAGQREARNDQIINWAVGLKNHFAVYMSNMHDSISLINRHVGHESSLGYLLKMGDYTHFIPMESFIENINSCKGLDKFDIIANTCKIVFKSYKFDKLKYDRNLKPQNINRQSAIQLDKFSVPSILSVDILGNLKPKYVQRRFLNEMMEQGELNLAERFARETNDLDYYTKNLPHALDAIEYRENNAAKIEETNNLFEIAKQNLTSKFTGNTKGNYYLNNGEMLD